MALRPSLAERSRLTVIATCPDRRDNTRAWAWSSTQPQAIRSGLLELGATLVARVSYSLRVQANANSDQRLKRYYRRQKLLSMNMRILGVETYGVGGLADGHVKLPSGAISAFAGANGTGKSKLLACLLSPWTGSIPAPRESTPATVRVDMELSSYEVEAIRAYSTAMNWGDINLPSQISLTTTNNPLVGTQQTPQPEHPTLRYIWNSPEFMETAPSLNVVYLPAERRLLPPNQTGIDLRQLTNEILFQKGAQSRSAVHNYGRLDDQEFEQYAKALCVAAVLPAEPGDASPTSTQRDEWAAFEASVNSLINPKQLLGLTATHPDTLRIRTPSGDIHGVQDLSSGERQALIIMSRVLRSGTHRPPILIDEPDAYLHPNLSKRLIDALTEGVGPDGQLVVATHSPAILDGLPTSAILRVSLLSPAHEIDDEAQRLDLYREAGFRASALTQSDLLVVTEGDSDVTLLGLLFPELGAAAFRSAGGKARVLQTVAELSPYDIPIVGVVDRDLVPIYAPKNVKEKVCVWPTADIEGAFLSEDSALSTMIDRGLVKPEFRTVSALKDVLQDLCELQHDNVVAELVQNELLANMNNQWPATKGNDPLGRLRTAVDEMTTPSPASVEDAVARAETAWNAHVESRFQLVRGKYVLNTFASRTSHMKSGQAILEAVARARPDMPSFEPFRLLAFQGLGI